VYFGYPTNGRRARVARHRTDVGCNEFAAKQDWLTRTGLAACRRRARPSTGPLLLYCSHHRKSTVDRAQERTSACSSRTLQSGRSGFGHLPTQVLKAVGAAERRLTREVGGPVWMMGRRLHGSIVRWHKPETGQDTGDLLRSRTTRRCRSSYCGSRVAICDNRGERLSWAAAGILGLLDMKIGTPNLVPRLAGSWIMKGPHGIMIKPYVGFLE
jgi:hypothetical protein